MNDLSPVVVLYDAAGNPIGSVDDGGDYRLMVDASDEFIEDRNKVVIVDIYKTGIGAGPVYYIAVDLSNTGGKYKHTAGSKLLLVGGSGTVGKSATGASWSVDHGVILDYASPNATIAWLRLGSMRALSSFIVAQDFQGQVFPLAMDLEVSAGDLVKVGATWKETGVAIGATVEDAFGDAQTPAVGDSIFRVQRIGGGGTATIHVAWWYYVE